MAGRQLGESSALRRVKGLEAKADDAPPAPAQSTCQNHQAMRVAADEVASVKGSGCKLPPCLLGLLLLERRLETPPKKQIGRLPRSRPIAAMPAL